ncbi:hypothetical protein D3C78_20130 [compost metagenome]
MNLLPVEYINKNNLPEIRLSTIVESDPEEPFVLARNIVFIELTQNDRMMERFNLVKLTDKEMIFDIVSHGFATDSGIVFQYRRHTFIITNGFVCHNETQTLKRNWNFTKQSSSIYRTIYNKSMHRYMPHTTPIYLSERVLFTSQNEIFVWLDGWKFYPNDCDSTSLDSKIIEEINMVKNFTK